MSCLHLVLLSQAEIHVSEGVPEVQVLACVIQAFDYSMILCSFNCQQ